MGKRTYTEVICDAPRCQKAIAAEVRAQSMEEKALAMAKARVVDTAEEYLQAGVYGFYAHRECFLSLTPVEVCKALGLDEVEVQRDDDEGDVVIQQRVWSRWS